MRHHSRLTRACLGALLLVPALAGLAGAAPLDAYLARQIWTGSGRPIEDGVLLVVDGKVLEVGPRRDVEVPLTARIHRLDNAVIIPGLVVAETGLAPGSGDGIEALAPQLRAIDGFDFFADFDRLLAGGITTVQIAPGGNRLVPGQGAVVKLAGETVDGRTLAASESLRIVLSSASRNPPSVFEPPVGAVSVDRPLAPTRRQLATSLAAAVAGLRALFRAAENQRPEISRDLDSDLLLGALTDYRQREKTFRVTASTAAEIRAALALSDEFALQLLLVDPVDLRPFADQLDQWPTRLRGVILNAAVRPGSVADTALPDPQQPPPQTPWQNARQLIEAGIKVGVRAAADEDLPELLFLAGLFQQDGLAQGEALKMVTRWPAELLGVADRVGTLGAGRDADFVVLSGPPLATRTQVLATYVEGRRVYDRRTAQQATVVKGAAVYDGAGRVIQDGAVIVQQGKIRGVGRDVSAPLDADVRHFDGGVIVPGFIDLHTGLGIGGPLSGTISVQTKLGETLFAGDPAVAVARQGGVTTVLFGSTSSSPTPLVAFKLGERLRVLKDPVALRFAVSGNLTETIPALKNTLTGAKAYADAWNRYEAQLAEYKKQLAKYEADLKKYEAEKAKREAEQKKKAEQKKDDASSAANQKDDGEKQEQAGEDKPQPEKKDEEKGDEKKTDEPAPPSKPKEPTKPRSSSSLEPYRPLLAGNIPALVEAKNANELRAAVKLFRDEFRLRVVFVGADDAPRVADLLAEKDVGVALGPRLVQEVERQEVNLPQVLANRQIPFGFQSRATTGVRSLPLAVRFAVRKGLSADDALSGLSAAAARLLSLDDRLGTIAVGRDADLVIMSGPPFELSSQVLAVMIDGKWVYEKERPR